MIILLRITHLISLNYDAVTVRSLTPTLQISVMINECCATSHVFHTPPCFIGIVKLTNVIISEV